MKSLWTIKILLAKKKHKKKERGQTPWLACNRNYSGDRDWKDYIWEPEVHKTQKFTRPHLNQWLGAVQWWAPVIIATWGSTYWDPHLKNNQHKKGWRSSSSGGEPVLEMQDPEFNAHLPTPPQKKRKKKKIVPI
jgi:hypothetical protein